MFIDIVIIIIIQLLCKNSLINTTILPAPTDIIFNSDSINILSSFLITLKFIGVVFAISLAINMLIVIIIYLLEFKYLENILYRLNSIPRIVIMLVGIAILGVGYKTISIMTIISNMPNFVITVLGYLKSENNKSIIEAAKDCGASDFKTLIKILIPTNIRGIIISTKILISQIINSIIIGEYLIGTTGIGSLLQYNLFMYNMKNVWFIALIICLFTIIISKVFDYVLSSKKLWFNFS